MTHRSLRTARRRRPNDRRSRLTAERLEPRMLLAVNVTNYQYSISTIGANTSEITLTPLNVNSATFGVKATLTVDGMVTAQPLYVSGVNITIGANQGIHNVVFVATEHDSVYAFDADTYTLLWHTSFLSNVGASGVSYINPNVGTGVTITSVPSGDLNTSDITPEVGIVGTPTINLSTNTMYLTPKTKDVVGSNEFAIIQLYALNLSNGLLQTSIGGGVITIADTQYNSGYNYVSGPSVNGTGDGSVNGVVNFNALRQMDRPAVTLDPNGPNGTTQIVLAFASHGDNGPYHGWILTYNASTLALTGVFNSTPDGGLGGTWQAGGPVVVDSSGNLFFETGNGTFGNNTTNPPLNAQGFPATPNFGDAVVKLQFTSSTTQSNPGSNGWGLQVVDYFCPWNQLNLNNDDTDMASSGLLILPATQGTSAHPELLIARGKSGVVYVLDANNMGKFNSTTDHVVEEISPSGGYWSNPTYWNGNLYGTASGGVLQQFTVSPGQISTSPVASSSNSYPFPGATGTISSNGTINGVLWEYNYNGGTETLEAYNATNVSSLLYTGPSVSGVKMTVPIVANGQVFAGENGHLQVYGLLSTPTSVPPTPTNLAATGVASLKGVQLTWTRGATSSANLETDFEIWRSTDPAGQDNFTMVGTASAGTTSFVDTSAAPGETYYYSVRSVNPMGHSVSTSPVMAVAPLGVFGIWTDTDVGGPLPAGSASFSNNTITISGGGSDIFGAAGTNSAPVDQFNFAYQPVTYSGSGNLAIVAEVSSQTNTNVWAKAGVLIRDTLDAGGEFADAVITPGNGAVFQYRPSDGASAAWNNTSASIGSGPYWVMLIRNGNTITGYGNTTDSSNLATWTNLGSETFASLPNTLYFGMAVTSHNNGTLSSAHFNNVVIGSPASPLPLAPSNLQVVVGTGSQLNLSWNNASNANADGYIVYRALGTGSYSPVATLSPTATTYFDTALTNGATYSYFVEASNTSGNSVASNAVTTTIPVPPGTPTDTNGSVGALTVSNLTTTSVTLSWLLPDSRDLGVKIFRRDTTTSLYSMIASLPAGTTTYTDSNLGANTDHDYNVQTYDAGGFSGAASTAIVTDPSAPTGLTASEGSNKISLTWTAPPAGFNSYTYNIYRGTSPGGEVGTPYAAGLTSTSYNDTNLSGGTKYYYTVVAVTSGEQSIASNEASAQFTVPTATIPAPSPNPTQNPVPSMQIVFNEPVSGFTISSLSLSLSGGPNLLTSSQTLSTSDNTTYTLNNLSSLTTNPGTYVLKFTAAGSGVTDSAHNSPTSDAATSFLKESNPVATVTPLNPSTVTTGPSQMTIVWNEAVSGFTISSLSLSRSGGPNLLTGSQTLTTSDNTTFTLNNLSSLDVLGGTYVLKFTAAGSGVVDSTFGQPVVSDASTTFVVLPTAPEVNAIYVSGTAWQQSFLNDLAANGLGDSQLGYRLMGGPNQLASLPWVNINVISVAFSQDVNINTASLALVGSSDLASPPALSTATYSYNSTTHVATWVYRNNLTVDKYLLAIPSSAVTSVASGQALDGEFVNGSGALLPSGDTVAGGDFNFRFNVLPGDVDQNGVVTGIDGGDVRQHFLQFTTTAGYNPLFDTYGKGEITGIDLMTVQSALLTTLPNTDPTAPGGGGMQPAAAAASPAVASAVAAPADTTSSSTAVAPASSSSGGSLASGKSGTSNDGAATSPNMVGQQPAAGQSSSSFASSSTTRQSGSGTSTASQPNGRVGTTPIFSRLVSGAAIGPTTAPASRNESHDRVFENLASGNPAVTSRLSAILETVSSLNSLALSPPAGSGMLAARDLLFAEPEVGGSITDTKRRF